MCNYNPPCHEVFEYAIIQYIFSVDRSCKMELWKMNTFLLLHSQNPAYANNKQ